MVLPACPATLPLPSLLTPTKNLALTSAPSCLELTSLTDSFSCMAKSPMRMASPVWHSKLVSSNDGLLCACMHLHKKEIHAGKCFKTILFQKIVCKSVPKGTIYRTLTPIIWLLTYLKFSNHTLNFFNKNY